MAQSLSRPLFLSRFGPWPPTPPSPRFPHRFQLRPGSQRMPRSGSQLRPPLQSLAWPPSQRLPLFHLLSQIPAQPLSQTHSQNLLKPGAQPLPLLQSPSQSLLPSHPLPLHKSQCPAQPNSLSQSLPSSLCLPRSLPLPSPLFHTLPLSQPRLRSGLQLPSALLLLLLLSVLGPGAGECRSRKDRGRDGVLAGRGGVEGFRRGGTWATRSLGKKWREIRSLA